MFSFKWRKCSLLGSPRRLAKRRFSATVILGAVPDDENDTGDSIRIWRAINHLEPALPQNWEEGWTENGRWHDLSYARADGAPMVRYTWVDYMPHATMPEMSFRIWEEFFSRFSRVDGEVRYL